MRTLRRLGRFVQKMAVGMRDCDLRFVREMVLGIAMRRDVMLSEIGRALREGIAFEKTEERLSRMAGSPHFDDRRLGKNFLLVVGPLTRRLSVIAVDLSDIQKPYARHMELLQVVRDGSTGERGPGYWLFEAVATDAHHHTLPLLTELYSTAERKFESQPQQVRKYLRMLAPHVWGGALWVLDRGFDGDSYFRILDEFSLRWVVRQRGDRHVEFGGRKLSVKDLASQLVLKYTTQVQTIRKRRTRQRRVLFNFLPVHLPDVTDRPLGLVVCRREDLKEPMMLLCAQVPADAREAEEAVLGYARRWSAEDSARGVKQLANVENIRVLRYVALQRVVRLAGIAVAWMTVLLLTAKKTAQVLLDAARWFSPSPHFQLYPLSEGLRETLGV